MHPRAGRGYLPGFFHPYYLTSGNGLVVYGTLVDLDQVDQRDLIWHAILDILVSATLGVTRFQ